MSVKPEQAQRLFRRLRGVDVRMLVGLTDTHLYWVAGRFHYQAWRAKGRIGSVAIEQLTAVQGEEAGSVIVSLDGREVLSLYPRWITPDAVTIAATLAECSHDRLRRR